MADSCDPSAAAKVILENAHGNNLGIMRLKNEMTENEPVGLLNLCHSKEKFSKLKFSVTELESRLKFYQSLTQDINTWPSPQAADLALKQAESNLRNAKDENAKIKESSEQLAEIANDGFVLLQEKCTELEDKVQKLEKARGCLEELKERLQRSKVISGDDTNPCDPQHLLQIQQSKLASTDAAIQQCKMTIQTTKAKLHKQKLVLGNLRREIELKTEKLVNARDNHQHHEVLTQHKFSRIEKALERLQNLEGVRIYMMSTDHLKLVIEYLDQIRTDSEFYTLLLAVEFEPQKTGALKLHNAAVNIDSFLIDDLVEDAIESNDLVVLVKMVQKRWLIHLPLLCDIIQVRNRFAIDWLQTEGLVRVMTGNSGHVICTLRLPDEYPVQGQITLQHVTGAELPKPIEEIKPTMETPTLEDWVEYLETMFGKP